MSIYKSGWVSPLKALETLSLTLSRGMKRAASPRAEQPPHSKKVVDAKGFRVRQQNIDKHKITSESTATQKSIHEEETEGANYVIEGRLRRVTPYFYTYLTYCKLRWQDRKLIDVFIDEFRDRTPDAYRKAVEEGLVKVNSQVANLETILRNGDLISHRSYRREPPVSSRDIKIVFEDDDLLVIDKPGGIPVHPTGRYRYNTVTKIFEHEKGKIVHPCNRLDRLTSGLMFLGKSSKGANNMMSQIRDRNVTKEYIARVKGEFPIERIIVDKPLSTKSPKLTLNVVDMEDGKDAKTEFQRVSYDPITNTSVVKCHPLTGRTHQIRVHLQFLGYPIANDPIYSSEFVWGKNLGENGEADLDQVMERLDLIGKSRAATSWIHPEGDGEVALDEICPITGLPLYSDPGSNDLDLWLHAYKYEADDKSWSYKTEYPEWALEPSRKFMKMAIEEAEKCGETQTQFNVGCVLVHNGQVISTGHSRELPGNTHAEQCALEKYFSKNGGEREVPAGTEIFTSMEPCSLRLSGNLPCVDRILQTKNIKTCFVGVLEPDIFVKNNSSYKKLLDHGVEYIHIPGYEETCLEIAKRGHEHIQE
ncbi:RluA family pseudouridine synthase [Candida albicans L26]|uniref:tRNA pseudouridine(32) synthase n=1 Tax=Candida albicans (strain SC5314 / ATCC MYA-2876) TaxID=237561 RepID=A0A1D8PND6_CANAL|nr:bifunctional DRAP deaminase/tRNA pseudouridine synthase [Candida albicans SC5314]AOW29623.1 bifunctional DRAP deaminase/tRNA pseudouridine synthase [Candida albicans SC5314]KGU08342.1 RluA family pseudouridine synthase [Candida albicans L26]|eukprot:XP_714595.2 bifunctional DRAP deaminase/tRNA pseudouridine synthase [Candida albicans SC5314]